MEKRLLHAAETDFYPRSPYGERPLQLPVYASTDVFLPTLSVWRATVYRLIKMYRPINFYPRSPYGERPAFQFAVNSGTIFLPTLSVWRATAGYEVCNLLYIISTHALRMESDSKSAQKFPALLHKKHTSYPVSIIDPQTLSKLPINPKVFSILFITIPVRTSQAFYARYSFAQTK